MNANLPISEQYVRAAHTWVDLDSAANLLEETKSAVLAQMMTREGDIPVSKAEMRVKASDEWQRFIKRMVEARTAANKAKVEVEYIRMKHSEWQSAEANHRVQARL